MAPSSVVEQAKAGNAEAIAFLLNRNLNPKGIEAKVDAKADGLDIYLSADQALSADVLLDYLQQSFQRLNPVAIAQVNLYGQSADAAQSTWHRSFQLQPPTPLTGAIAPATTAVSPRSSPQPRSHPRNRQRLLWLWLQW